MFDLNGDGYIDLQELKTVMTNMGDEVYLMQNLRK